MASATTTTCTTPPGGSTSCWRILHSTSMPWTRSGSKATWAKVGGSRSAFRANVVRLYRGEDLDFTLGGDEAETKINEIFGRKPQYAGVLGLCRTATITDISAQGWSLNPGRYVGVAPGEAVSDEGFKAQLETLNEELESLNTQARDLEQTIADNVAELLA